MACELDGGAALLDLKSGSYFRLNQTGSFVWSLLESPRAFGELFDAMAGHFDVDAEILSQDLKALIGSLLERGLISAQS
ncbi:hypothetical protein AEAC466_21520 [Asticcacaulis sp. AC466]|nr:hypothetical protein AEAC466_21520 [Asticcacaulis sp. AC466]